MVIWRDIEGYEGMYQVSDDGQVKSLARVVPCVLNGERRTKEIILKPAYDVCGYLRCALCKNSKLSTVKIHRLVAKAFVSNPDNKTCVNHINGIKDDNRVKNLEWVTHSENSKHAHQTGLHCQKGHTNNNSKLDKYNVQHIRGMYAEGTHTPKQLAEMFGVSRMNVYDILNRKTWTHIGNISNSV